MNSAHVLNSLSRTHPGLTIAGTWAESQSVTNPDQLYRQWLTTDLVETGSSCLPEDVVEGLSTVQLTQPVTLQINSIINVGASMYSQLKKLQGKAITETQASTQYGTTQGTQRNTQYSRDPPPSRMLFIEFTDGTNSISGMEYRPIPQLSVSTLPGCKVIVSQAECRLGVMLLQSGNVNILGGSVDELCEQNTQEILLNEALHGEEEAESDGIANGTANANVTANGNTNTNSHTSNTNGIQNANTRVPTNNAAQNRPPQNNNAPQSTNRQQHPPQASRPATTSHAPQRPAASNPQPRQTSIQNYASNPPQPIIKQEPLKGFVIQNPVVNQEPVRRQEPVITPGVIKQEPVVPSSSPQQADFIDDFLTDCLDLMEDDCETSEHSLADLATTAQFPVDVIGTIFTLTSRLTPRPEWTVNCVLRDYSTSVPVCLGEEFLAPLIGFSSQQFTELKIVSKSNETVKAYLKKGLEGCQKKLPFMTGKFHIVQMGEVYKAVSFEEVDEERRRKLQEYVINTVGKQ